MLSSSHTWIMLECHQQGTLIKVIHDAYIHIPNQPNMYHKVQQCQKKLRHSKPTERHYAQWMRKIDSNAFTITFLRFKLILRHLQTFMQLKLHV